MALHAETPSSAKQAQFYRTTSCAQCGRKLLTPERIEHLSDRILRYLWSCEGAGTNLRHRCIWCRRGIAMRN
jgi:hypothetical protein